MDATDGMPPIKSNGQTARQRVGAWIAPAGSLRDRCLRKAAQQARRAVCRATRRSGPDLAQILLDNANRRGIVVYPPFIDWNWMRQRPHQLMAQFAKAGYLALFCSPKSRADWFRGFQRLDERLYLCDSPALLAELPNPILLTSWTGHWKSIKQFRSPVVIYDYLDDLGVSSNTGAADARKIELHRKLAVRADVVLATSRRLFDEIRQLRPDALLCPNGVDYEHFHVVIESAPPADVADAVRAGRPIIGYYGALARWFDYELVERAARERPSFEFVLIGPNLDGGFARSPLARLPNVRWLGEKRYEELPAYLQSFTVATIPFRIDDITKATSPVKLFEYMAGVRPIVTTDMPECREYESVATARDAGEFVAMLDEALVRGRSDAHRRLLDREAAANTWAVRVRQIIDRLDAIEIRGKLRSA